jgi:hypothetical protein
MSTRINARLEAEQDFGSRSPTSAIDITLPL